MLAIGNFVCISVDIFYVKKERGLIIPPVSIIHIGNLNFCPLLYDTMETITIFQIEKKK